MLYFAYGSNMLRCRLEERVGLTVDHGTFKLKEYKIKFNKRSIDGSGKTNIIPDNKFEVLGVIYEISKEQLDKLDEDEKGYKRSTVPVVLENNTILVETYIAFPEKTDNNLLPTKDYLSFLIYGSKEHNFPEDYVESLQLIKTR